MILLGWSIWEATVVASDSEKTLLSDRAYRMYDFTTISEPGGGYSYIRSHDQFFDMFSQKLYFSFAGSGITHLVEINNMLKVDFDPLVFRKVLPGIRWGISSTTLGNFELVVSRETPPVRGAESVEDVSLMKVGMRYSRKIADCEIAFQFANEHRENYSSVGAPVFDVAPDYPLPEPAIYIRIADSDPSDGNGGQFFGVKVSFWSDSSEIAYVSYTAGSSLEDLYVVKNTGTWSSGGYWFMDGSTEYIARFPFPSPYGAVKKIYIIVKTGGDERLVQLSTDGSNFYTVPGDLMAPDASTFTSIRIPYSGALAIDSDADPSDSSTWDDGAALYSLPQISVYKALSVKITVWKNVLGASLRGKLGLADPYNIQVISSFSFMKAKYAGTTAYSQQEASAYYLKLFKPVLTRVGVFEPGLEYYRIGLGFDASEFVDPRVAFERGQEYGPEDGVKPEIPLPSLLDFNLNGVVDGTEDFYMVDSSFPIYYADSDMNLNFWDDTFEVDVGLPDYYGKFPERGGLHAYLYYSPFRFLDLQSGYIRNVALESGKKSSAFYAQGKLDFSHKVVNVELYERAMKIGRNYWDEFRGWCDGFDNDRDGLIDEQDELSLSSYELYTWLQNSFTNKFLLKSNVYLPVGLSTEVRFGSESLWDLKNSRKWTKYAVGGTIDFQRDFSSNVGLRAYVKADSFSQKIEGVYFNFFLPTAGTVIKLWASSGFTVDVGALKSFYVYSYNNDSFARTVFLVEGVGRNTYLGKDFLIKVALRLWKNDYMDRNDESWQSSFMVRAFFFY